MARSRKKANGTRRKKRTASDTAEFMAKVSERSGRISGEDIAYAIGGRFGGPVEMADLMFEMATDPNATVATRAKILQNLMGFIKEISKQYGDEAKLKSMPTEEIKRRLVELIVEHRMVIPIPGVKIDAGDIQKKIVEVEKEIQARADQSQNQLTAK